MRRSFDLVHRNRIQSRSRKSAPYRCGVLTVVHQTKAEHTMIDLPVKFSHPYRAAGDLANLQFVLESDHAHGDGSFTASASKRLSDIAGAPHVLLTTSCTHALEMCGLLLELGPGDEVIVPSYAFPSAATWVAIRGANCVFVDVDPETGNVDPDAAEAAVTDRTRAIYVMHYGGIAADMQRLLEIASRHAIEIIEDNAHGLGASWEGKPLGTLGFAGTLSFHDTKNIHCGEGGAILLTDRVMMERAEIIREKGTDRSQFLRGQIDKYSWRDIGSSYLLSEFNSAVLDAQLSSFEEIEMRRNYVWRRYDTELAHWADNRGIRRMSSSGGVNKPSHLYFLLTQNESERDELIAHLRRCGVIAPFHYVPLDSSKAGRRYGTTPAPCIQAARFSSRILRLPLWAGMNDEEIDHVIDSVRTF